MSLLHDALKKAEKEGGAQEGMKGILVDSEEGPKPPVLRVVVLGVLVSVAVLAFLYVRILKKPSAPKSAAPASSTSGGESARGGGSDRTDLMAEAVSLIRQQKYEEAKSRLDKALAVSGTPKENAEAYNNLGYVLKKTGRNEEASDYYQKALALDPGCAECLNNLGVLYLSNRDLAEAENRFQKAIEVRPDYADPYLHLALIQEANGDNAGAKRSYSKFAELARGVGADFLAKVQERITSLGSL